VTRRDGIETEHDDVDQSVAHQNKTHCQVGGMRDNPQMLAAP